MPLVWPDGAVQAEVPPDIPKGIAGSDQPTVPPHPLPAQTIAVPVWTSTVPTHKHVAAPTVVLASLSLSHATDLNFSPARTSAWWPPDTEVQARQILWPVEEEEIPKRSMIRGIVFLFDYLAQTDRY